MTRRSTTKEHVDTYTESVQSSQPVKLTADDLTREKLIELVLEPINIALSGNADISLPEYLRVMRMLIELKGYDKEEVVSVDKSPSGSYRKTKSLPVKAKHVEKQTEKHVAVKPSKKHVEEEIEEKHVEIEIEKHVEEKPKKKAKVVKEIPRDQMPALLDELEALYGIAKWEDDED